MKIDKLINVDNKKILLHKKELSDYLNGKINNRVAIEIDPSLSCNHKCPECTFKNNHKHIILDDVIVNKIIRIAREIGIKGMIITGGGEPCIYNKLGWFVKEINNLGIDITLTTNGQLIHRHFEDIMNNLKRIRFSIDACNHISFKHTHGMEKNYFEQIIKNLKNAVEYKRQNNLSIDIGVSYLICKKNANEVFDAIDFYKNIGIDFLHFKPMQLFNKDSKKYYYEKYSIVNKNISKIKSYSNDNFRVDIFREKHYKEFDFNINYSKCHGSYFSMIIGADGKLYTCCHFKYNPKYCYGDLRKDDIYTILKNVKSEITKDCFKNCKMDAINQLIEYGKNNKNEILQRSKDIDNDKLSLGSKWL